MNFILYSDIGESTIDKSLGLPEYSYYFVLKAFRAALAELGTVTLVRRPETEVDPLFEECRQRGEECVFLSFSPPSKTAIDLKCPTVSVFAWEYSNIPNEQWDEDPRSDWRNVFARHGRAITLSGYTARAVKDAMGQEFPVLAVPAPLWEQFAGARERLGNPALGGSNEIRLRGTVIDSRMLGLSADGLIANAAQPAAVEPLPATAPPPAPAPAKNLRYRLGATKRHLLGWYRDVLRDLLPLWLARTLASGGRMGYAVIRPAPQPQPDLPATPPPVVAAPEPETAVKLDGVVYTSVFSPTDGRKNWFDMVTAFCWTFREVEDVTLVLKMNERDLSSYRTTLMTLLSQLAPFKCRVVTLHAFLDDDAYEQLIGATTYYVNTSLCEGLCLPLMEFMSCGKPSIAPSHTAMADYIDEQVAFVVKSGLEQNVWPHDPRDLFRTLRYRLDWSSICSAYRDSYQVARQAPETYAQMRAHTLQRMQSYASVDAVKRQLQGFFHQTGRSPALHGAVRDTVPVALASRLT
jgi:glycosyltransferase involved in cell wall biosynthesis